MESGLFAACASHCLGGLEYRLEHVPDQLLREIHWRSDFVGAKPTPVLGDGQGSERGFAVHLREYAPLPCTLGSRFIRGHVKPRSHKGFGGTEVTLGSLALFSTEVGIRAQGLPQIQFNVLSRGPRLIAGTRCLCWGLASLGWLL